LEDSLSAPLPLLSSAPSLTAALEKLQKKEEEISAREAGLKERERVIAEKESAVSRLKDALEKEKEHVEEISFNKYLARELKRYELEPEEVEKEEISAASPEEHGIYTLIERAKNAVDSRRISEAKELYRQIKDAYSKLRVDAEEKKKVYYDVMALKTDIEIASIS
jgi:hypothetical protein